MDWTNLTMLATCYDGVCIKTQSDVGIDRKYLTWHCEAVLPNRSFGRTLATRVCDIFTGEFCSTAATTMDNFVPAGMLEQRRWAWRISSTSCFTWSH